MVGQDDACKKDSNIILKQNELGYSLVKLALKKLKPFTGMGLLKKLTA